MVDQRALHYLTLSFKNGPKLSLSNPTPVTDTHRIGNWAHKLDELSEVKVGAVPKEDCLVDMLQLVVHLLGPVVHVQQRQPQPVNRQPSPISLLLLVSLYYLL